MDLHFIFIHSFIHFMLGLHLKRVFMCCPGEYWDYELDLMKVGLGNSAGSEGELVHSTRASHKIFKWRKEAEGALGSPRV